MPSVKLSDYECERDMLPPVCMFCGNPATTRVRRNFSWHPGWVYILILVNLLITLVVALILTKKMTVRVPVCDEHEGYWRRRFAPLLGSFVLISITCIAGFAYMTSLPPGQ